MDQHSSHQGGDMKKDDMMKDKEGGMNKGDMKDKEGGNKQQDGMNK